MSRVLYDQKQIQSRIKLLANKLNKEYFNKELTIVYFLNSASFFVIDLLKYLKIKVNIIPFSFKPNLKKDPPVFITLDVLESLENKNVMLLEGMIITGNTPLYLIEYFKSKKPKSLKISAIGIKSKLINKEMKVNNFLFDFDNEMVVGYGIGNSHEKCILNLIDKN